MKREKIDKKKEITKVRSKKKTRNLITNKRIKEREPDLWKEVYSGLKLLGKKYKNFKEKQKIKKQKEEQRRLKEQEEQRPTNRNNTTRTSPSLRSSFRKS